MTKQEKHLSNPASTGGLGQNYRKKAEALEKAGYFRFAALVRGIATTYDRDSEREASRVPFEE